MGMGFAPTWLRQVRPPLLHKTTLTIGSCAGREFQVSLEKSLDFRKLESL